MCESYSQIFQTVEAEAGGLRLRRTPAAAPCPPCRRHHSSPGGRLGTGAVCPWPGTAVSSCTPSGRAQQLLAGLLQNETCKNLAAVTSMR